MGIKMPYKDKEEQKTNDKVYYLANKDKIKAQKKSYHLANVDKRKAYCLANKEKIKAQAKAYGKAYRPANKEKIKAQAKAYYLAYPEQFKVRSKKYRLINPEKFRAYTRKRRALKQGNAHEPYTDTYIYERDNWTCQLCGRKIHKRLQWPRPRSKSIDHIVPLSRGGADAPNNLQATHLICNNNKRAKSGGQLRLIE